MTNATTATFGDWQKSIEIGEKPVGMTDFDYRLINNYLSEQADDRKRFADNLVKKISKQRKQVEDAIQKNTLTQDKIDEVWRQFEAWAKSEKEKLDVAVVKKQSSAIFNRLYDMHRIQMQRSHPQYVSS